MKKSIFYSLFLTLRPNVWLRIIAEMLLGAALVPQGFTHLTQFLMGFIIVGPFITGASYMLNDITDRKSDALHPLRKRRAIASGAVSVRIASLTVVILFLCAVVTSFFLSVSLLIVCLILFLSEILYTLRPFRFKEIIFLDISLNTINAFARFSAGYFLVGGQIGAFPIFFAFFAVAIKVVLFLGHRWQNRSQEKALGYKSTVALFSEKQLLSLLILVGIFGTTFFVYSIFYYNLPLLILLYPFVSALFLLPLLKQFLGGFVRTQEKSESTRNYLYVVVFLFSLALFVTTQLAFANR